MTKKVDNGIIREMTTQEQTEHDNRIASIPTETDFERSITILREKRNSLLEKTDWIVIKAKETGGTIPSAWKTYRQELRDLTNGLTTVDKVNAVEFPERPST